MNGTGKGSGSRRPPDRIRQPLGTGRQPTDEELTEWYKKLLAYHRAESGGQAQSGSVVARQVPLERVRSVVEVGTCPSCHHSLLDDAIPEPGGVAPEIRVSSAGQRRRPSEGTTAAGRSAELDPDLTARPRPTPHPGSRLHALMHLLFD